VVIIEHEPGGRFGVPVRSIYHHLVREPIGDYARAVRTMGFCDRARRANQEPWPCYTSSDDDPWLDYLDFRREVEAAQTAVIAAEAHGSPPFSGLPRKWGWEGTALQVRLGDRVHRGQQIGYAGDTGIGSTAVHLHFGLAIQHPKQMERGSARVRNWWTFDPYGLYAEPSCYAGVYPSGQWGGGYRHPSLFAPVMPDHALVPTRIELLAIGYYGRMGWTPITLCAATVPCTELPVLAASFQPGERKYQLLADQANLAGENQSLAALGWSLRSVHTTAWHPGEAPAKFVSVWQRSTGRPLVWYTVPPRVDLTSWLHTATANLGGALRICDICPYYSRGNLALLAALEVGPFEFFDFGVQMDIRSDDLRGVLGDLVRRDRIATRLHHYLAGGETRFLVIHRRRLPNLEEWTFHLATNRSSYCLQSKTRRGEGFNVLFLDVVTLGLGESYYYGFVRPGLPI